MHYPWHVLHENGEGPFLSVPQATVVLNDSLMEQVLQQLDLTFQGAHLLQSQKEQRVTNSFPSSKKKQKWYFWNTIQQEKANKYK